jgi:GT2 family glycosyltransferase
MLYAVTVTYNGASVLQSFLDCVASQVGIDWHLIIVDNASSDETRELLMSVDDPRISIILNEQNFGVAGANNQGIKIACEAGAETVLLVNNDTEFDSGLFYNLAVSLETNSTDAVTPLIPFFDKPDRIWYAGGRFLNWRGGISFHDSFMKPVISVSKAVSRTEYAPTCCLAIKASVFDRIGYMDEQYFVYWDDTDFCWRMNKAGMAIAFDPNISLLHKVSISTGGSESDFSIRYLYRNHMIFLRKYRSKAFCSYVLVVLGIKAAWRLSLGHTNIRKLRLQLAAMYEGLTMSIARE